MTAPDPLNYGWWLASRSAGIVALVAASASVIIGLLMANGLLQGPGMRKRLLGLHESVALAALLAIAVHALTLLPDPWLKPNLAEIVVPFTGGYRPFYTGLGIIAAWGAAILGLSYYFRRRIGPARWRSLHRLTIVVWALGVIHTLGAGTDGGQRWMVILVAATTAPILFLFVRRMLPETPDTAPATGEQPRRATPSAAAAAPVRTARSRSAHARSRVLTDIASGEQESAYAATRAVSAAATEVARPRS